MNAIELLKQDHVVIRQLLEKLSATTERAVKTRTDLLNRINAELVVHTELEEQIFYPAFLKAGGKEEQKMIFEATEEHRTVDSLVLPDLLDTRADSVQFSGRMKVLQELLEHHLQEEEEDLFPRAAKLLKQSRLRDLGKEMENRKRDLKQSVGRAA